MNKSVLHKYFYIFQNFVEMYGGEHFDSFRNNYFLEKEEGYKYTVFSKAQDYLNLASWKKEDIGSGYIATCFKKAYNEKRNLVYFQDGGRTEAKIDNNNKDAEAVLYELYLGTDDSVAFENAVNFFGAKYDLIAYMFFIKNSDLYLPITPQNFEKCFATLGIDIKLQRKCSWSNYTKYISLIRNIKDEFEKYFGFEINLLDAHSFVWMIDEAERHFITKEMWIQILKNESLSTPTEISFLKDFYNAPNRTSTCSKMQKTTGTHKNTYNLTIGKAGKRISKHLNFTINERENKSNGETRGWSVFFRGQSLDNNYFEWQVKPELAEALESLYPELLLNQNTIESIVNNDTIMIIEDDADTELHRKITTTKFTTQSEFKEFVGIPREKPELIETKQGKHYKRDKQRALNALNHADYLCEYNNEHPTFLRKNANVNYTESHHLVPMAFQDCYPNATLDTESNIVSLCSNCHNQIHYGQGAEQIITELYNQRKEALASEGIEITLGKLLAMYNK